MENLCSVELALSFRYQTETFDYPNGFFHYYPGDKVTPPTNVLRAT
jgi:hypothetical protein